MTGSAPTGSITPPICAAALMCTRRADLRARADERMRVDERALADVGADVDEHRRHADDALARRTRRRESTSRRARCGCRRVGAGPLERHRVLVVERQARDRHVDGVAEAEAEQDALLDPRVDAPAGRRRGIGLGRAHLARAERRAQARRRPARAAALSASAPAAKSDSIVGLESHGRSARLPTRAEVPRTAPARRSAARRDIGRPSSFRTPSIFSCDAGRGGTIGSRNTSSHSPIAAIANFTGPGFDSMKLPSSNGSSRVVHRRARRRSRRAPPLRPSAPSRPGSRSTPPRSSRARRSPSAAASAHRRRDSTRKSSGTARQISAICCHVARRFLHADDVRDRRRAARTVAGSMLQPVRPGTL